MRAASQPHGAGLLACLSTLGGPPGLQQTHSHPKQALTSRVSAWSQGWREGSGLWNQANKPGFESSLAAHRHIGPDKSLSRHLITSSSWVSPRSPVGCCELRLSRCLRGCLKWSVLKKQGSGLSWWPGGWDATLSMQETWVRSLVEEMRSNGQKKKKHRKSKHTQIILYSL